jgi:hydrogenase maturation protein HypF
MADVSATSAERCRLRLEVRGIVQGVGFRPYVHGLATSLGLAGFVGNDGDGVFIEVEGAVRAVDELVRRLPVEAPPLAAIASVRTARIPVRDDRGFVVVPSVTGRRRDALIAPDTVTCAACLAELFDPTNRRYRYPFVNCTDCGPRFTIVTGAPYDRARTTMAGFAMCGPCAAEYENPDDRRFHAEATCCPTCGPHVRLVDATGRPIAADAVDTFVAQNLRLTDRETTGPVTPPTGRPTDGGERGAMDSNAVDLAVRLLARGLVVAVKGLGGYHLAVAADQEDAVARLRARKHREEKPFALLVADLAAAARLCVLDEHAEKLLTSPAAPIVLLPRRPEAPVAPSVAPGNRWLGVMLPSTPLHDLLARGHAGPLVLTSGNLSDEPIAHRDDDAFARLAGVADAFLTHDRPIHMRADDSVVRVVAGRAVPVRRSRGYAPAPMALPVPAPRPVLAVGAELKNTFCLARGGHAFVSQHQGDLENYETFAAWEAGIEHWRGLFDVRPAVVAHDLHPEYMSTKYALDLADEALEAEGVSGPGGAGRPGGTGVELVPVQHHHAHIASCLADNGSDATVIGVALDGLGYGSDGGLWGGEVLVANLREAARVAHLAPVPQPGGAAAVREPWRMAAAHVWSALAEAALIELLTDDGQSPPQLEVAQRHPGEWERVLELCRSRVQAPPTTSMGRLFDAVAALAGVRDRISYEGQAAIELEQRSRSVYQDGCWPTSSVHTSRQRSDPTASARYSLPVMDGEPIVIHPGPLVRGVVDDLRAGADAGTIGARFHRAVAAAIVEVCRLVRTRTGLATVALSGGVFQNALLLELTLPALEVAGFEVLTHRQVPPNDGGISLGQAAIAAATLAGPA